MNVIERERRVEQEMQRIKVQLSAYEWRTLEYVIRAALFRIISEDK